MSGCPTLNCQKSTERQIFIHKKSSKKITIKSPENPQFFLHKTAFFRGFKRGFNVFF